MALFVGLAGRQVARAVADRTNGGAGIEGVTEFPHKVAALAAIGFAG